MEADLEPLAGGRKSRVTLHLFLEKRPLFRKKWLPVEKVGKMVYHNFMEDIVMEIYRVLYDGA